MFGVSFTEIVMVLVVALVVAGPKRLPEILGTLGRWIARIRHMTTEVRKQTGIDDILRAEGLSGGIQELRSLVRGEVAPPAQRGAAMRAAPRHEPDAVVDAYGEALELDRYREFPVEGPDAYGAIPEDLAAALAPEPTRPDAVPAAAPAPVPAAAPSPGPDPAPGGPGPAAPPPRPTSGAGAAEAKEPA